MGFGFARVRIKGIRISEGLLHYNNSASEAKLTNRREKILKI